MIQPGRIEVEKYIPYSAAKVWRALTDPILHAKWWAAGDILPIVGHRFELDMGGNFGKQKCEIVAVEPRTLLSYSFAPGVLNTTITWRLQPEGNSTRLFLEHKGFDLESPSGKAAFEGMGAGWPRILERISPTLSKEEEGTSVTSA